MHTRLEESLLSSLFQTSAARAGHIRRPAAPLSDMKRAYKIQEFVAHTGNVNCVEIGKKTSRVLVTGGEDSKVNMWAVGKPNPILSLAGHSSAVESVTFDVREVLVVAGSASGTVKLWDLEEARIVRTLTGHRSNCTALDFHPFGEFFASGSLDTNLKVWDVRRRGCIHTYKGHTKCVKCVRFSPDGRWVVSGGEDNVVKLWDLTAGKLMHEFKHHDSPVECLDFHPQEFLLATGSADRTVKFVDLETFASIGCAGPETTGVRSLVFHPDGHTLLYGLHESLKVYSWEPLRCHDVVEVGWSKLADLSISEGKLLGCSYNQSCVGVWVVDLAHVAPHGAGVARGFGSPRSSFSFRSPKLITSRDLQQVGEGLTRLSMDRDQGAESVREVSAKSIASRDPAARYGNDGMARLNSARDLRFSQLGDGVARSSLSKDRSLGDLPVEGDSKPITGREPAVQHATEGSCKLKDQMIYHVNDEDAKLNASRDFPVQQVRNGVDQPVANCTDLAGKVDCDNKTEAVLKRSYYDGGSGDGNAHQGDESSEKSKDSEPQLLQDLRRKPNSFMDVSTTVGNGVGHKHDFARNGNVDINNPASRKDSLSQQSAGENGSKVVTSREQAFPEAVASRPNSGREHQVLPASEGSSNVSAIREQLFTETVPRLNNSRVHPAQPANETGNNKASSIKEIMFPDAGPRMNSNRDFPAQPASDTGSRVSSIKEQLFPDSGTKRNLNRDHSAQQSNDGASRVMTIREQLFPESGNRLNRDHTPRHFLTSETRKPVDVVVKRPIAFEVMNTSPRILQMDAAKPGTPSRSVVKVEDHSLLIGSARSASAMKSNAFQNGSKGFGFDADAFVSKGNRLERSNSFSENGLKPLGLDMNAFAPKGSLNDRGDAVGSDVDLIKELMEQHQTLSNILLARLTNMQVVHKFLAKDDLKGAVEALGKVADPSVLIDMVNVLMGKCDSFTLEICSMLLPSINQLLNSDYEKYLLTGIALLTMLVKNFGPMIHSTRAATPGVGVDLEQERRLECCNICYEKLQTVKQSLVPLTRRGGQLAKAAHDLSTTLDEI